MATVELLALNVKKNGQEYVQVKRNEHAFIYSFTSPKYPEAPVAYEVFKRKEGKPYTLIGKGADKKEYNYPAKERFPGNEDFGKWAWACGGSLEMAERIFEQITTSANEKAVK